MITIPLSQLIERGVQIEAAEAVAIVQALASSAGDPSLDNVEVDSDGAARYRTERGEPSVRALAVLLDRLLPASGIPGALRYTVARGMESVEAPTFASVADFSQALTRFETGEQRDVIRGLLARARPVRTATPPPPPAAVRPAVPAIVRPIDAPVVAPVRPIESPVVAPVPPV